MSALRLARGITGRDKILKFEGCYHGHADSLLVKAGSGLVSLGIPECPGIVSSLAEKTLTLPFNNIDRVRELFEKEGKEIAALIVEPIGGNMGVVPPKPGFLEALSEVTKKAGALLIFDEVMTGFRVSLGGAQKLFGVTPDITCMGKIIGGGLPVGAYGGSRQVMDYISPMGSVYQAGTLSGNPLAMAAGNVMFDLLSKDGVYESLEEKSVKLCQGLKQMSKISALTLNLPGLVRCSPCFSPPRKSLILKQSKPATRIFLNAILTVYWKRGFILHLLNLKLVSCLWFIRMRKSI